jgi:CheY-like chemotaxis protein
VNLSVAHQLSASRHCILVVDDDADVAWTTAALLKLEGHDTHIARDGREAIELVRQLHPSIVLMDLGMPSVDGFEAARQIRKEEGGNKILLCAVTAYGSQDIVRRVKEAGFDRYLRKPANFDDVSAIIGSAPVDVLPECG